jgi:hypothetical protein
VPEEFLDRPDVVSLLQPRRGKTGSEGLTTEAFVEPHRTPYLTHGLWSPTLTLMIGPGDPGAWDFRQTLGGKDVWPDPESAGMRILAFQRERSRDRANPVRDILCMDVRAVREMFLERYDQAFRQHGDPILHAFVIVHDDLRLGNVEILDTQSQTFHQPQPATTQQFRHESWGSGEMLNDFEGFVLGQDVGKHLGFLARTASREKSRGVLSASRDRNSKVLSA